MGQPLASPLFGKDNLPVDHDPELGGNAWAEFRKLGVTRALRIEGPFRVATIHGGDPQLCHDGWLAIDNQGHPYPIDHKVFSEAFEPASPGEAVPEAAVGPPSEGWRGDEPHEGTRRRLVRDVLLAAGVPGRLALIQADKIEEALLAVEDGQGSGE